MRLKTLNSPEGPKGIPSEDTFGKNSKLQTPEFKT